MPIATRLCVAVVLALVCGAGAARSATIDRASPEDEKLYKSVFPDANIFSVKGGAKPHVRAYKLDPTTGDATVVGFVFRTDEVEPDEYAYSSQIAQLVGLTTAGKITAVKVISHREPFGYFSVDPPDYVSQYQGKSILNTFEVGEDIDAVTRATITIDGGARVIKKSARRIMQLYLAEQKAKK
ncbi:MAG: FMN-binding protein [Alphaproteobacteria bacterium]|nr:FMN-binding protein [Alphaproteobacteria bacterium]